MGDHNGIEHAIAQGPKVWQGIFAFLLRMHAAVEDESLTGGLQVVAIGADFGATRQVNELQISILALPLTRALALFPPVSSGKAATCPEGTLEIRSPEVGIPW